MAGFYQCRLDSGRDIVHSKHQFRWIRDQSVNYDAFGEFEADLESFVERMTRPVVKIEIKEEIKEEIDC